MNLDDNAYAVYTVLKEFAEDITPEQTREVDSVFDQFPDYQWNEQQERELRINLYRILRLAVTQGVMTPTNALLEYTTNMKSKIVWNDSEDLKDAVWEWADRMGVTVREVHLRDMRRKWASISTNGRLTLSTDLLDLPEALGEFVIVHELVHLLAQITGGCSKVSCPLTCPIGKSASTTYKPCQMPKDDC